MINFDYERKTYICPYCGCKQAINDSLCDENQVGYHRNWDIPHGRDKSLVDMDISFYYIKCSNNSCNKFSIIGYNKSTNKQWDIQPENVYKIYPDYIPKQILDDYREASLIVDKSPRAAATLLRRCLQGMIHDFWNINGKNLNVEITCLKDKISPSLWKAIDGIRSIGNIGAHMEKDVNLIIDIDKNEARKLLQLIELLFDKWYITRHDVEELYNDISECAEEKEAQRKKQ